MRGDLGMFFTSFQSYLHYTSSKGIWEMGTDPKKFISLVVFKQNLYISFGMQPVRNFSFQEVIFFSRIPIKKCRIQSIKRTFYQISPEIIHGKGNRVFHST